MNKIHIARNRQALGQFSPQEVSEGLASGEFLPTDLAWREPMETWKPLSEFGDLPPAVASLTPPALPQTPVEPEAPVEPAWERRKQLGTFSALVETVRQVLAAPVATFSAMKREGGLSTPLFFYLVVTTLATWVAMAYQLTVVMMNPEAMLGPIGKSLSTASLIGIQILSMALAPMLLALVAYCSAGIFHLVFQLLGRQSKLRSYVSSLLLRGSAGFGFPSDSDLRGFFVFHCRLGAADLLISRDASSGWGARDHRRASCHRCYVAGSSGRREP